MCDLMDCKECGKFHPQNKVQCDEIKELWNSLTDVPVDPETGSIEAAWYIFPIGSHVEEIWEWFSNTLKVDFDDLME